MLKPVRLQPAHALQEKPGGVPPAELWNGEPGSPQLEKARVREGRPWAAVNTEVHKRTRYADMSYRDPASLWWLSLASSFHLASAGCEDVQQDPRASHFTSYSGGRLLLTSASWRSPWRWHDALCPPRGSWGPHRPSHLPLRGSARPRARLRSPSGFTCMMEFPLLCIPSAICWTSPVCCVPSKREDRCIQFRKMSCYTGLRTSGRSVPQYSALFISWVLRSDSKKKKKIRGVLSQKGSIPPPAPNYLNNALSQ